MTFNVYHTQDLSKPFVLFANVPTTNCVVQMTYPQDFFEVRALSPDGIESEPATK